MFSKLTIAIVLAMGAFVSADNKCSSGPVQCCNSVQKATPQTANLLSTLFGTTVTTATNLGLTCSPITESGSGTGSNCQSQTVCCENNNFNGLVAIGCSPITINV